MVAEGVATRSDDLSVNVALNEAEIALVKARTDYLYRAWYWLNCAECL